MAAPKRKQDSKTASYSAASKKPKFGKEPDKPKSTEGKKDAGIKKSKKPVTAAKSSLKCMSLSVESDSDELSDGDEAFEEIKDDGSENDEEVDNAGKGDEMDVSRAPNRNGTGCKWSIYLALSCFCVVELKLIQLVFCSFKIKRIARRAETSCGRTQTGQTSREHPYSWKENMGANKKTTTTC